MKITRDSRIPICINTRTHALDNTPDVRVAFFIVTEIIHTASRSPLALYKYTFGKDNSPVDDAIRVSQAGVRLSKTNFPAPLSRPTLTFFRYTIQFHTDERASQTSASHYMRSITHISEERKKKNKNKRSGGGGPKNTLGHLSMMPDMKMNSFITGIM